MNANVFCGVDSPQAPERRAMAALLPGAFALLFAGVSGVAAAASLDPRRYADRVAGADANPADLPPRHQSERHVLPAI